MPAVEAIALEMEDDGICTLTLQGETFTTHIGTDHEACGGQVSDRRF